MEVNKNANFEEDMKKEDEVVNNEATADLEDTFAEDVEDAEDVEVHFTSIDYLKPYLSLFPKGKCLALCIIFTVIVGAICFYLGSYFSESKPILFVGEKGYALEDISGAEDVVTSQAKNFAYLKAWEEYFGKYAAEVSEDAVEAEYSRLKASSDSATWDTYVQYNFGSEDNLREAIKSTLMQDKALESYKANISISDKELKGMFDADPTSYNYIVGDSFVVEDYDSFKNQVKSEKDFNAFADSNKSDVSVDVEYSANNYGFDKDFSAVKVGDIVFNSLSNEVMYVKKVNNTWNEFMLKHVKDTYSEDEAYNALSKDYENYLSNLKVTIFGKSISLTEEASADN